MNLRLVAHLVAILAIVLGVSMIAPLIVAYHYGEACVWAFLYAMAITCTVGGVVFMATRGHEELYLSHRDGVTVVACGWIIAGLAATLPFMLSQSIPSFTDAYFEAVSGFTTTGSSILKDIEILPKGILFWRAQIQWMGGMGIIVLSIAILPFLGVGGMQLYKAETPSPVVDKLTPRIADTAAALWKIYIALTVVQIVMLAVGGMPIYDSVCHTFTTMPTGGFSTKNQSIAYYNSAYVDYVIILFMFLAGMNFSLHYRLVKGNFSVLGRDREFRAYLFITVVFVLAVAVDIYGPSYPSAADAVRHAAFQVVSIMTTTGFSTADFEKWPVFSQQILLLCMFIGSMAGSTGGGIKVMRIILLVRHAYLEVFRVIHPHATTVVKFGDLPVPQTIMRSIWGFALLYLGLFIVSTLALAVLGMDMISSLSAVAACLGNVGPGLGTVGPTDNFADVPLAGKWILTLCMLIGRLEIYTIMVLLTPAFWRK